MIEQLQALKKELEEECNGITTNVLLGQCGSMEDYIRQTTLWKSKKQQWERLGQLIAKAEE